MTRWGCASEHACLAVGMAGLSETAFPAALFTVASSGQSSRETGAMMCDYCSAGQARAPMTNPRNG